MQRYRQQFYAGNRANLTLLHSKPEQISGNLNSYAAYGTYYSIIPIHGGETLEQRLKQQSLSLHECVQLLLWILDALECFHRHHLLYLDISPDNILLLPHNAMLIDYNSVWSIDSIQAHHYSLFGFKSAYAAPEVRLQQWNTLGLS